MLNGLDLFSGIGGISLALSDWVRPIAYCEIDKYCQGVLLSRMANGNIPVAPIWDDVGTLRGETLVGITDIIYGGFPCQDISVAGHGKGLAGERSGLFWEIYRLAKEILPSYIFLENVPAITSRGGLTVVRAITEMGYDCRWCVISAASVGAVHKRERWFCLARNTLRTPRRWKEQEISGQEQIADTNRIDQNMSNPYSDGCDGLPKFRSTTKNVCNAQEREESSLLPERMGISRNVADTEIIGCQEMRQPSRKVQKQSLSSYCGQYESIDEWQEAVSTICRVTDGIPQRMERLRGLGNAVVPAQAKEAFKILMGLK